jgi:hypothetical protein
MINTLCQFQELAAFNLDSLDVLAYGGSPIAPRLYGKYAGLPAKLLQVYGLSEAGFLTGLTDAETQMTDCSRVDVHAPVSICELSMQPASLWLQVNSETW